MSSTKKVKKLVGEAPRKHHADRKSAKQSKRRAAPASSKPKRQQASKGNSKPKKTRQPAASSKTTTLVIEARVI